MEIWRYGFKFGVWVLEEGRAGMIRGERERGRCPVTLER
jgi:hypothetical protein